MSAPTSMGAALPPSLTLPNEPREKPARIRGPGDALTAPFTPDHQLAVIDRSKVDPNTLRAAQGMEAMFLDYMYKVMRETVPKSDMDLENHATEIYRGMMDSENAQKAARAGGIGLADQIVAYLESQRYTQAQGQRSPYPAHPVGPVDPASPPRSPSVSPSAKTMSTGGTPHEG